MQNLTSFSLALAAIFAAGSAAAEGVEIYLSDMLDNTQSGYCIDISGGKGSQADPADGLQGHTCYSPGGSLGVDQTFDSAQFSQGVLYMTNFDVCAQVSGTAVGSSLELAACDSSQAQKFVFSGAGAIVPTGAPELCLTLGEATRHGRSDVNQIKELSLQVCAEENTPFQTWDVRSGLE